MKKIKMLILYFLMFLLIFPACSNQSSPNPLDNASNGSLGVIDGKWVEQKADTLIFDKEPDFTVSNSYRDLTIKDYEVLAEQKNVHLIWAMEKSLSPSKYYGLFNSNRNCLESETSVSIFVKNMKTGEEVSVLTGDDTFSYHILNWWLDDTRFVFQRDDRDCNRTYGVCTVNGEVTLLESLKDTTLILQHSSSYFISYEYGDEKTISFSKIETNNHIESIGEFSSDNYIMEAVISPDFKFIALKTRENYETYDRMLEILDSTNGLFYKIEPPIIQNASGVFLNTLNWESTYLRARYDVIYNNEQKFVLYEYQF